MQRRWQVLTLVSVATFVASLDLFIVNIAFPDIRADFGGASVGALSWVLNAYAIVFAALLVPAGRLADRAGRKRGFLAGLGAVRRSARRCAALAPSVATLVAARVLQAAGAALLVPTSLGAAAARVRAARAPGRDRHLGRRRRAPRPRPGRRSAGCSCRRTGGSSSSSTCPSARGRCGAASRLLTETRDPDPHGRPDWLGAALLAAAIGALALGLRAGAGVGLGRPAHARRARGRRRRHRAVRRALRDATRRRSSTRRCCASARSRWPTSPRSCSPPRSARCCSPTCSS